MEKESYQVKTTGAILGRSAGMVMIDDLILAITKLMNMMKDESVISDALNLCNETNAYKNKGERTSFDSYRGLFRTPVF